MKKEFNTSNAQRSEINTNDEVQAKFGLMAANFAAGIATAVSYLCNDAFSTKSRKYQGGKKTKYCLSGQRVYFVLTFLVLFVSRQKEH